MDATVILWGFMTCIIAESCHAWSGLAMLPCHTATFPLFQYHTTLPHHITCHTYHIAMAPSCHDAGGAVITCGLYMVVIAQERQRDLHEAELLFDKDG